MVNWDATKLRLALFCVFLLPAGCVALVYLVPSAIRQNASRGWPGIGGQVQTVDFTATIDAKSRSPKFTGRVIYEYHVEGERYVSDRTDFSIPPRRNSIQAALADVADYRPGQRVRVYYNPTDPATAVLVAGMPRKRVFLLVAVGAVIVVGALGSCFAVPWLWRDWRNAVAADEARAARYAPTEAGRVGKLVHDEGRPLPIAAIGDVQATYRPDWRNPAAGVAIAILLIVGGVAAATWGATRVDPQPLSGTDRVAKYFLVAVLGIGAPIGGLALLRWAIGTLRHRVVIGEKGLAYVLGGYAHVCTWDRVLAIEERTFHESLPILKIPGAALKRTARILILHRSDGKDFTFTVNTISYLNGLAVHLASISREHGIRWDREYP